MIGLVFVALEHVQEMSFLSRIGSDWPQKTGEEVACYKGFFCLLTLKYVRTTIS